MRSAHLAWAAAVLLAFAAAPAAAGPTDAPPAPRPRPTVERYRIEGAPEADGCGGRIVLAARHIQLDRARGRIFADVVNRTYTARVQGDRLLAEGSFRSADACPGGVREAWSLRWSTPRVLTGTLQSTWQLAPRCEPCTVTFRLRAVRVP